MAEPKKTNGLNAVQITMQATPEERLASSQRASRAHSENARRRREEKEFLRNAPTDLIKAAQMVLAKINAEGHSNAEMIADRLAEIASGSESEANSIKAASQLAEISGQIAPKQIKVETEHRAEDLGTISTDELRRLEMELRPRIAGAEELEEVAE